MEDWQRALQYLSAPNLSRPRILQQGMARGIALDSNREQACPRMLNSVVESERVGALRRLNLVPKRAKEVAHGSVERVLTIAGVRCCPCSLSTGRNSRQQRLSRGELARRNQARVFHIALQEIARRSGHPSCAQEVTDFWNGHGGHHVDLLPRPGNGNI